MSGKIHDEASASAFARFPDGESLEAFLHQIRLWNRVEGLPRVDADPANDRVRVRLCTVRSARAGVVRLIEAFGGRVLDETRA